MLLPLFVGFADQESSSCESNDHNKKPNYPCKFCLRRKSMPPPMSYFSFLVIFDSEVYSKQYEEFVSINEQEEPYG